MTSCTPCAKAKAACKPFNADKAYTKIRIKVVWRFKARKIKQQIDIEWKVEVSRKLEDLSELQGLRKLEDLSELQSLRKDVWRIAVALKKLAGIED